MSEDTSPRLEWIMNTPRIMYTLSAGDLNVSAHPYQEIELTDPEYEALKRHLAVLRGHVTK
jgi:hypothetical protein